MARGSRRSSASRNTTYEVSMAASPVFRAAANPRFSCRIRVTFGNRDTTSAGLSVDPSSTTITASAARGLRAYTLERLLQKVGVIVGRHHHADSRRRG